MKLNAGPSIVDEADGNWHKILAIVMLTLGHDYIEITAEDINALAKSSEMQCVVLDHMEGGTIMVVQILPESEARARAEKKGYKLK